MLHKLSFYAESKSEVRSASNLQTLKVFDDPFVCVFFYVWLFVILGHAMDHKPKPSLAHDLCLGSPFSHVHKCVTADGYVVITDLSTLWATLLN